MNRPNDSIKTTLLFKKRMTSSEIGASVKLSVPQVTRILKNLGEAVLRTGKGKNTRYYLRRETSGVHGENPIYRVDPKGQVKEIGSLFSVYPKGFCYFLKDKDAYEDHDDLPYFLDDLRPSGFLGRLIPKMYPEWGFPSDIQLWSSEATLRFLTNFGSDLVGDLIIGEEAARKFLENPLGTVSGEDQYSALAESVEKHGTPGSSAGGEHAKFLTRRETDKTAVLVKFVKMHEGEFSQRRVDLLHAEHYAVSLLCERGNLPPMTRVFEQGGYTFLEVIRFDRIGTRGRKGVISLRAIDAEFLGSGERWSVVAPKLSSKKLIDEAIVREIYFREFFGGHMGNSDMHSGNLSFFTSEDFQITGLTLSYDMLPARYAPHQGQLYSGPVDRIIPTPRTMAVWEDARLLAERYWGIISDKSEFSKNFRDIAKRNYQSISSLRLSW